MEKELHPEIINEAEQAPALAPERYNEMYNEAREGFYEEKEKTESEKIEDVKSFILETTQNRTLEAVMPDKNETVFTLPKKESSAPSWMKKAATVAGITLMSLLPWKEAKSQSKVETDKNTNKKEVVASPKEYTPITDQIKEDWGKYVKYAKENHLTENPKMKTKAFADAILTKYIQEHKGTSLTPDIVKDIQNEFVNYRAWVIDKIENKITVKGHKMEYSEGGNKDNFMAGLSKVDDIAGPLSLREFPKEFQNYEEETIIKGNINGKNVDYVVNAYKAPTKEKGFVSMDDK